MSNHPAPQTITRLLHAVQQGDEDAGHSLVPLIYAELRGLAQGIFAREQCGHTLQPTALVHEAWLKLAGHLGRREGAVEGRRHFFRLASRAMRQVLADHARGVRRQKRGEGNLRISVDLDMRSGAAPGYDLVDLEDVLTRLGTLNRRHAQVVEIHLLAGLTMVETAAALGVSRSTVEGDWFTAKAWLRTQLRAAT